MSGNLLEFFNCNNQYDDITFHVVVGSFHQHKDCLVALSKKYHNVILYNNVTEMSKLMLMCDIAISAGGSTLYELCSCSLPTISFSYADNQRKAVREFDRQEIMFYAGDARDDLELCLTNIENRVKQMMSSFTLRKELAERMGSLVDGLGAQRIICEIVNQ
jgi:spore coat polysaccharide biosynthesis predicted glycosyltransferase SpsG